MCASNCLCQNCAHQRNCETCLICEVRTNYGGDNYMINNCKMYDKIKSARSNTNDNQKL